MEKFKALNREEKLEHIWIYYKYHIFGSIILLISIISLSITLFGPQPPEPTVNILLIGKHPDSEDLSDFKESIEDLIPNDEERKVELLNFPVSWEDVNAMSIAMEQKLILMLQSGDVDILMFEQMKFNQQAESMDDPIYIDLEDEPELNDIMERYKDDLIVKRWKNNNEEKAYGISVKNNIKLKNLWLSDEYLVTIPEFSPNKDNAIEVMKWLYE